jgi:hypothetical protein
MDTIRPLTSIPSVASTTSESRGQQTQQNQLPLGQLLKAVVVDAKASGQFILDIGGSKLTAQSQTQLSIGQNLQLQVVNTSPQVELKIVTDTLNQFIGKSITLVGKNIDLSSLFQTFNQTTPSPLGELTPISRSIIESFFTLQQSDIGKTEGGAVLKQLLEGVGLNLEHNLARGDKESAIATLKAALLEVVNTFKDAQNIATTANKVINTIELFQLAQLNTNNETFLIFPLPLPFIESGYLSIEKDGSKDGSGNSDDTRFSLHLTMSDIGHLNIDFSKNNESLMIRFRTESVEKMEFIQQFSKELIDTITNNSNISISFASDATDPVSDLIRKIVPKGQSILDTKA